jgi:hypothetical protein
MKFASKQTLRGLLQMDSRWVMRQAEYPGDVLDLGGEFTLRYIV